MLVLLSLLDVSFKRAELIVRLWDFYFQLIGVHSEGCLQLATFSGAPKSQGSQATQGHRESKLEESESSDS